MQERDEIREWRALTRRGLLELRAKQSATQQVEAARAIGDALLRALAPQASDWLGFYWPIRGEIDLRAAVEGLIARGARAALPEVTARDAPLTFRPWHPDCAMRRGVWDIPVPDTAVSITPTLLLIPCVAADQQGYRLGYGGGFYDRTLATLSPRPLTIGIVLHEALLPSIHPQEHDIPLDAVVSERAWVRPLPSATNPRGPF